MTTNRFHTPQSHVLGAGDQRASRLGDFLSGTVALAICIAVYAAFALCIYVFATSAFRTLQTNGRQQMRLCERANVAPCSRFAVK